MRFLFLLLLLPAVTEAKSRVPETYSLAPPPTIERKKSDAILGLRFGQFGPNEGALSVGANFEFLYSREFGFGLQAHRSSYGTEIAVGDMKVDFTNTAITLVGLGNYHFVISKAPAFDPYLSVGVAHSFVRAKANVSGGAAEQLMASMPEVKVKAGKTSLAASASGRYFLDQNLSVVGSVALGLSTLSVGMDYLF